MSLPHIPILRRGEPYESLETAELRDPRTGGVLAVVSQANAGLIRRDLGGMAAARRVMRSRSTRELIEICRRAGELFVNATLPGGLNGGTQSPGEYVELLSATSGLPHVLCRRNMDKIHQVFTQMEAILRGLTRGIAPEVLDRGTGEHGGVAVSFRAEAEALGVVLPSNSPGVNSLWMPAIALKVPVVLKPGREEPWTPYRIIQAFVAAGCPAEAFGFYPTNHEGAGAILKHCRRSLLFGDARTTAPYAGDPGVQIHGPGWSKVLIGDDEIGRWREHLDVLVESIVANGGRSCINASAVVVPAHGDEIAEALAERLAGVTPRPAGDEGAQLSAFANADFAGMIDATIEEGLMTPGADDVTARHRGMPRKVAFEGATYLLPTIVRCANFSHPLANREFLFPYASVVEVEQPRMLEVIGPSLVVSAITHDPAFTQALLDSRDIDRLNLGPLPTTRVQWDQPHEGNLFEFLYRRRAIQHEEKGDESNY